MLLGCTSSAQHGAMAWDTMDCVSGAWPQEQQQQEVT